MQRTISYVGGVKPSFYTRIRQRLLPAVGKKALIGLGLISQIVGPSAGVFTVAKALTAVAVAIVGCELSKSPTNAWYHFKLAEQLRAEGKYKEAIAEYRKFLAKEPEGETAASAHWNIAIIYTNNLGDNEKAAEEFEIYGVNFQEFPRADFALRMAIILYDQVANYAKVKELCERFKNDFPDSEYIKSAVFEKICQQHLDGQ